MPLFECFECFLMHITRQKKDTLSTKPEQRDVLPATSILRPSTAVPKMLYALPTLTGLTPD